MKTLTTELKEQIKKAIVRLGTIDFHWVDDLWTVDPETWVDAAHFYLDLEYDRVICDHIRYCPLVVNDGGDNVVFQAHFEQAYDFVNDFLSLHQDIQSCYEWKRDLDAPFVRVDDKLYELMALIIVLQQSDNDPAYGIPWEISGSLRSLFSELGEVR